MHVITIIALVVFFALLAAIALWVGLKIADRVRYWHADAERRKHLAPLQKRIRYRIGARLLREHVAASLEANQLARESQKLKGEAEKSHNLDYIAIGLKYAIGLGTGWRTFDDEQTRMNREALNILQHAHDPLD